MKKGWNRKQLGDVLEVQNGYAFDSKRFNLTNGLPLIRIRSLKTGVEAETRFDGEFDEKYVVRAGDLLIGMDGEFGCYEWKGEPSLLNQRVCRLQGFSRDLLPRFLLYGVNDYLKAIEEVTGYATVKHLSSKQILAIKFPVPPLPEQKRIVGLLDEAFEGLATAQAHAAQNLQNARDLFESHLNAVFGDIWKDSTLVPLAELASDITDGDHLPPPKSSHGVPFITIGNIVKSTRHIDFSDTFKVTRDYFDSLKPNRRPRYGDVLYTVTGSFGIPVLVDNDTEFCFQRHIGLIRPKPSVNSQWLSYLMLSPQVFGQANSLATGTAQRTVSLKSLRSFVVPVVSTKKQDEMATQLNALSAETQRLTRIYEQKLAALAALKKSLLHQAFSGEL